MSRSSEELIVKENDEEAKSPCCDACICDEHKVEKNLIKPEELNRLLSEREAELRAQFQVDLDKEMQLLKGRFDFILQNEQTRTAHMLREAHRERQEKIGALRKQLECKNLAALMYVLCSERRSSRLEKMRIIEEYTTIIRALQNILTEGQSLIVNMSKGYKTASKVEAEWQEKMVKVVREFQIFINDYVGGASDTNQYFFNLPAMLKTKAPLENPLDDPWEEEGEMFDGNIERSESDIGEKTWWQQLDDKCRPFIMYGNMAEFEPPQRREILKVVKDFPAAPKEWKKYVFHEMFLKTDCSHNDLIKHEYERHHVREKNNVDCQGIEGRTYDVDKRRGTTASLELRNMGSMLKIIASSTAGVLTSHKNINKSVLGARDSMEIASTTKFREKCRQSISLKTMKISSKTSAVIESDRKPSQEEENNDYILVEPEAFRPSMVNGDNESATCLGSIQHQDSMDVITGHEPDVDHKIHYEKVCPMEKCQRMQTSSFLKSLPSYMKEGPFTYFQQTFDDYEACTPEQLEILMNRIEEKKKKEHIVLHEDPLEEWNVKSPPTVEVQTSEVLLPECTCDLGSADTENGLVLSMSELIPQKIGISKINQELFFDNRIEFNRFKVVGHDAKERVNTNQKILSSDFKRMRMDEINKILAEHPSLCEIFQAARS